MPRRSSILSDAPSGAEQTSNAPKKSRRSLDLNRTITLALLLVASSVVLTAVALHNLQRRISRETVQEMQARFASEVIAAPFGAYRSRDQAEGPTDWSRHATLHEDVLMAAVLDASRNIVAAHPNQETWVRQLLEHVTWAPLTARIAWPPRGAEVAKPLPAYVTRLDAPVGYGLDPEYQLIVVLRGVGTEFGPSEFWTFHVPLLLIAIIGLGLGLFWLRRQVLVPIAQLSHVARSATGDGTPSDCPIPPERRDEIGQLAEALRAMQLDIEEWRRRATRLERDFDWRVAAETRQITAALNRATRDAWMDGLTGLYNRRALDEKLHEYYEAQVQAGQDLAVAMFDLDNFKTLNDTQGHAAGDELLQFVGELLRTALRQGDVAFRYGGDEFLMLCPGVTADVAAAISDRLVRLFGQRARLIRMKPALSLSAGIASVRRHKPEDALDLLRMADEALYEAKSGGKSTVVIYDPSQAPVTA